MGSKTRVFGEGGIRLTLDERLREVTAPYQVRRARSGELMACSLCGRVVEFTYRTVCGMCFLAGKTGKTS